MRRNGAHSVSDCLEKAWWKRCRDIDGGDMPTLCGGRENVDSCTMERSAETERHGAARIRTADNMHKMEHGRRLTSGSAIHCGIFAQCSFGG